MLSKILLPLRTSLALKTNDAIRISEGYRNAESVGVIFSYEDEKNRSLVNRLLDRIESDGKEVNQIAYVPQAKKEDEFNFPNFINGDMDFLGRVKNEKLIEFEKKPFDYLLNLDLQPNLIIENVLANSKAKCRVGKYNENKHTFYELMIDFKEGNYEEFLVQIYHYIKSVRNG